MHNFTNSIKSVLLGVAVGDALGVPFEMPRRVLQVHPVTDMCGYGTYNQPAGTFSDDSSLTFCLAEALTQPFYLHRVADNFVKWRHHNYWTAHGVVFDVGITTELAIEKLIEGASPEEAGGIREMDNGNGSLMRIAPLLFYIWNKPISERFDITQAASSITHRHIRSVIACFYYLEFARQIFEGKDKFAAYTNVQKIVADYLGILDVSPNEIELFDRLLKGNIYDLPESDISSRGYVLHTLEASIWCLLTTDKYKYAVLKAVNLGGDTDTTAAVTGGLAGLLYGIESIPSQWLDQLARREDIEDLAERMAQELQ
jgi:ADP-ribosylglycohydrolase